LKPDTYDGSVSLNEFLIQFELIARVNRWMAEAKTAILISCLRGKARVVLESVLDLENLSYDELKSRLELRFGRLILCKIITPSLLIGNKSLERI